jgi:hypothetical protein
MQIFIVCIFEPITDAYEASRGKIQNHINAQFAHEVLLLLEPLLNKFGRQRICFDFETRR